jgi:hypothetical protein
MNHNNDDVIQTFSSKSHRDPFPIFPSSSLEVTDKDISKLPLIPMFSPSFYSSSSSSISTFTSSSCSSLSEFEDEEMNSLDQHIVTPSYQPVEPEPLKVLNQLPKDRLLVDYDYECYEVLEPRCPTPLQPNHHDDDNDDDENVNEIETMKSNDRDGEEEEEEEEEQEEEEEEEKEEETEEEEEKEEEEEEEELHEELEYKQFSDNDENAQQLLKENLSQENSPQYLSSQESLLLFPQSQKPTVLPHPPQSLSPPPRPPLGLRLNLTQWPEMFPTPNQNHEPIFSPLVKLAYLNKDSNVNWESYSLNGRGEHQEVSSLSSLYPPPPPQAVPLPISNLYPQELHPPLPSSSNGILRAGRITDIS